MVNLEQLTERGLRAYELGRLRVASRVVLVLLPAIVICLLEARARQPCACFAVLLLGLSVWLRWRDRPGFDAVRSGLLAGTLPFAAGLLLTRLGFDCGARESASLCTGLSVVVGLAAGVVIAVREVRRRGRFASIVAAGSIAVLAASLGCLRLGIASVLGAALGIAVGATAAAFSSKASR